MESTPQSKESTAFTNDTHLESSNKDITKCRNALNKTKIKKKAKQDKENALRAEVNISNDEMINLEEIKDSIGNLKTLKSFGPIFSKFIDKRMSKQANLSNVIRKEQLIAMKEYICRWAYERAILFHVSKKDRFVKEMQAVGQFGPNGPPPTRYETDEEASDSIVEFLGALCPINFELQDHINMIEFPMYKMKLGNFDQPIAIKSCAVNSEKFDSANWWDSYGDLALNLRKIAVRILSLTTSSPGCERIWSIFEGVHMEKIDWR
nr:zinc finger, BED-type [Tanacetum cinerariifolium]